MIFILNTHLMVIIHDYSKQNFQVRYLMNFFLQNFYKVVQANHYLIPK